ncbi:MAG: putative O-linked GlcNAc transferase-putative TPR-containing transrane protein, partial [Candidatus Acidoferrum typicum]|nr:putative O-linked GlcNAc transferase-putative TPR-containing transrane protein [Candidatus Acidoferrum typicum]
MKRVFSNPLVVLIAGLCLRLFFVLKFPANSGDTVLYEQIATNWLKQHVYGMDVGGAITPVDLRMPGYPAFLVLMYALTGRTSAD